jgi:hypothetical protein
MEALVGYHMAGRRLYHWAFLQPLDLQGIHSPILFVGVIVSDGWVGRRFQTSISKTCGFPFSVIRLTSSPRVWTYTIRGMHGDTFVSSLHRHHPKDVLISCIAGASMTLVGLLPPLCDNGDMLVDGGYGESSGSCLDRS